MGSNRISPNGHGLHAKKPNILPLLFKEGVRGWLPLLLLLIGACSTPSEPVITPPQPQFADTTMPPNPVDHRIYADVNAQRNVIDVEWKLDPTNTTTGYILYRSNDSLVGSDGLLLRGKVLQQFESSNSVLGQLPDSYQDTNAIAPGAGYWYQLQAYYKSPSGVTTYSIPTHVDLTTSFQYETRPQPDAPANTVTVPPTGLQFRWEDPDHGGVGRFQIIVQNVDNGEYVWSDVENGLFGSTLIVAYPATAPKLLSGAQYQWRVKKLLPYGGSSSEWLRFMVSP